MLPTTALTARRSTFSSSSREAIGHWARLQRPVAGPHQRFERSEWQAAATSLARASRTSVALLREPAGLPGPPGLPALDQQCYPPPNISGHRLGAPIGGTAWRGGPRSRRLYGKSGSVSRPELGTQLKADLNVFGGGCLFTYWAVWPQPEMPVVGLARRLGRQQCRDVVYFLPCSCSHPGQCRRRRCNPDGSPTSGPDAKLGMLHRCRTKRSAGPARVRTDSPRVTAFCSGS